MSRLNRRDICRCVAGSCDYIILRRPRSSFLRRSGSWCVLTTILNNNEHTKLANTSSNPAGPLIGGYVFAAQGWQWTQWVTLMLALAAYLLGVGMPETYPREIIGARARRLGVPHDLMPAASGTTLKAMLQITLFTPFKMLFSEPLVIGISLYLGLNFAVIFSFFVSIPVVLNAVYNFDIQQIGLAFIAAIAGSLLAAATSIFIDRLARPETLTANHDGVLDIEYRLYPAMIGGFGITASLFWIGWTASPTIRWASPVIGTLLYVWGNLSVLVRLHPHLPSLSTRKEPIPVHTSRPKPSTNLVSRSP